MTSEQDTGAPWLRLQGIHKRYGAVSALKGVDFAVRRGEVMALLGENGAGKSTLVKVLSGLVTPDEGTVTIDGAAADIGAPAKSQAAGIAVVQQEYSSVAPLSVAENLQLGQTGRGPLRLPWRLRREALALLAQVGLDHVDPRTPVEELSVAEVQLVELARVLARDAKLVVLDEPTAALSDVEIERVLRVVRNVADSGRSVIYVTHRLPEVFRIADRITVFRNGESLEAVPVSSTDTDQVIRLMLGRELSAMYPDRRSPLGEPALRVDGLLVPGLQAPVSFTVRRGEIIGLTGQLGSGASAVAQGLAGVRPVMAGTVTVGDERLSLRSRAEGIRHGIAYCSPDRKRDGIFAALSVRENLSAPWLADVSSFGWVSRERENERARKAATEFQVDASRFSSPIGQLSGGNQQKIVLGRWLGTSPDVLIVEEPTRGVDVGARAEIYERLRDLCDAGLAVVVVSSDTAEVLGLSDTVATFYKGRMTASRAHDEWDEPTLVGAVMHAPA